MNRIGLAEVEKSKFVVSFKKSLLLLISHHGALCPCVLQDIGPLGPLPKKHKHTNGESTNFFRTKKLLLLLAKILAHSSTNYTVFAL